MVKKVVFYNTYEPVVSLFRDLGTRLSEEDYEITLVVSRSEYRKKEVTLSNYFSGSGVHVKRIGLGFSNEMTKRWQKTIVMLSYYVCAFFHACFSRADLRVFLTQPPFFSSVGRILKKTHKEDYICILMDLYPEVIFANKLLSAEGMAGKWLSKVALASRSESGGVVVIGRDMANYLKSTGVPPEKIEYIPNWSGVETDALIDNADNALRQEWGFADDDFLVFYSGNMGVSHYFTDLLNVAKAQRENPKLKFVFVGGGPRKSEIVDYKNTHGLDNVYMFDYQPTSRLVESLSAADAHFISLQEGYGGLVVPSKVFGVLSVGRPIIFQGSAESEIARMLQDHSCGVQVDTGDEQGLASAIDRYVKNRELTRHHGNGARDAYLRHYSSEVSIAKYVTLINSLSG